MPVVIRTRADISLDALHRVAWDGERVEIAAEALDRMDRCHSGFVALVDALVAEDPQALV